MSTGLPGVLANLGVADAGPVAVTGDRRPAALASPLAVADCAIWSVAACLAAAADLARARTGRRPDVSLDAAHVAAAVRSEAWLRDPAGQPVSGFAPLSRLWPARDGWVRTHANYPWHRAALLRALDVADGPDADLGPLVARAIAGRPAHDVQERAYLAGGLAVAAQTAGQWRASAPGRAAAAGPLAVIEPLASAPPLPEPGPLPASGLRVLDLTRVIAGPAGTRMLGALGAEVLRLDHPDRPELPLHAVDGVIGKASAVLDVAATAGRRCLKGLLSGADVLVTGYRPGALRRFGLEPGQLAARHPHLIVVTLSAWGATGPWATRRGFDSLVQVASGIGWAVSRDGQRPGVLPCQLLDHATGYLIAAGALAALARRARTGQASQLRFSLARTACWLLGQPPRSATEPAGPAEPPSGQATAPDARREAAQPESARPEAAQPETARREAEVAAYRVPLGDGWTAIAPPGQIDGRPLRWPHLPPRYARARPAW